jgi:hypothetical protein
MKSISSGKVFVSENISRNSFSAIKEAESIKAFFFPFNRKELQEKFLGLSKKTFLAGLDKGIKEKKIKEVKSFVGDLFFNGRIKRKRSRRTQKKDS